MRGSFTYTNVVGYCKLPTLSEAMQHYRDTGEFILSARDDDAYDSDSRDFDPIPVSDGEIDVVSAAAKFRERSQDIRQKGKADPAPAPDPSPSPSPDPAPSGE